MRRNKSRLSPEKGFLGQVIVFILIAIFWLPLSTLAQADKIERIEDFHHYYEDGYEVFELSATTVGTFNSIPRASLDTSDTVKVPNVQTVPKIGFRYSSDPDNVYFVRPSEWAFRGDYKPVQISTFNEIFPVFKKKYIWAFHLQEFSHLMSTVIYAIEVRGHISVKNWPLTSSVGPDQVQVVVFLDAKTAAKGKNLFTLNLPVTGSGKSSAAGSGSGSGSLLASLSDKAVPAGIVFALMFLALGLSGAAAGAGSASTGVASGSSSQNSGNDITNDEFSDKEEDQNTEDEEQPKAPQLFLKLNRKEIVIIEGCDSHPAINATVVGDSEGGWDFSLRPLADLENAVASCSCKATSANSCQIRVIASRLPDGAGRSVSSDIQVLARNNKTGTSLETILTIVSAKKGLVLIGSTPIRVAADGETESKIEITALTAFEGKISTDFDLLQSVRFSNEFETSSETSTKAFTTAAPVFRTSGDGAGWHNLRGFEKNEPATFIFRIRTARLLPGQGESYFATAYLIDNTGQKRLAVPLMLDVDLMQHQSRAWEIELDRCRQIISRLPEQHRARLLTMVDAQSAFLGAKGLYELRKKIWKAGQALWEAEGLAGYESVERWAGFIENTLNFSQWAGRMATDVVVANKLKLGVFAAMAVGEIYDLILSGIQAYQHNKTFDQWFEDGFWKEIRDMLVEMGAASLEPDKFVAKFGKNRKVIAIAWSVQFGYHFIANLTVHKMPVIDAAKKAATTVATAAALKLLAQKVGEVAKKKGLVAQNIDDAAELGWQDAKTKVADFENALKSGNKKTLRDKMLEIQSDKFALKEINKWPKDVKQAYNDEIGKMYASIDKRVKKKIIQDLKSQGIEVSNKNLNMTNATNAKKTVKVGSDRDISVEYSYVDKNGREVTFEYPKDKLRDAYGREFYRTVGHKNAKSLNPDELMDKYDQYALDSTDAEAYGLKRKNFLSDGLDGQKIDKIELENSDFAKAMNKNGLEQKFDDSMQIGMTASYKGKHWFNKAKDAINSGNLVEGESFKMEGMSQLVKQYKNIYKPRHDLIEMMGRRQADDTGMRRLINMMEKAVNLEKSPVYVEKLIKENGYSSLHEFADAFGGKIASMNSSL